MPDTTTGAALSHLDRRRSRSAPPLARRLLAEFLGTGLLVAVVVGSGIAAQRLSPTDAGLQLLQNSLTTVVRARRADPAVRAGVRRPLQPRRLRRRLGHRPPRPHRPDRSRRRRLHRRPDPRRHRRGDAGQRHVRARRGADLHHVRAARRAVAGRDRRHRRADRCVIFALARTGRARSPRPRSPPRSAPPTGSPPPPRFANPAVTIARIFTDTFAGIAPASVPDVHRLPDRRRRPRRRPGPVPLSRHPRRPPTPSSCPRPPRPPPTADHRSPTTPTVERTTTDRASTTRARHARGRARGAVRLRPQRRPLPDGRRTARPPRRRRVEVRSAGSTPADEINPAVRRRHGRDRHRPRRRRPQTRSPPTPSRPPTSSITMGCGDACPSSPASATSTGTSPTPPERPSTQVRPIRDNIDQRVRELLTQLT